MGTKTPSSKSKREIACEVCDMKFQTIQARTIHVSAKHPVAKESVSSPANAAVTSTSTPRASKRLQLKKGSVEENDQSEETKQKMEFECPKCPKIFPIYFQAMKHIQKKHCEDILGNPVSPKSMDSLKPLQVITRATSDPLAIVHKTDKKPKVQNNSDDHETDTYYCLGCDEQFTSIPLFNRHLSLKHLENMDSMFFKAPEEFEIWKQKMEMQVKIKYLPLSRYSTAKHFQCNYVSPKNEYTKTYLCPSSISTKEFKGGMQIHYRKDHCDHNTPNYVVPKEFAGHITNKSTKDPFDELLKDKTPAIIEDLYTKFSNLLSIIIKEAKNADDNVLKTLFESAIKMRAVLNDDDDNRAELISRNMTDDQITDALEGKGTFKNKRKSTTNVLTNPKKVKISEDTKETISKQINKTKVEAETKKETISKENNKGSEDDKKIKNNNIESPKIRPKSPSSLLSPSSFNDTYKQFLGVEEKKPIPKVRNTKRKEVVKTKMGQFSPKKKLSIEVDKSPPNILKPSRTNTSFYSKDIKYEVREQENDCNILILKI